MDDISKYMINDITIGSYSLTVYENYIAIWILHIKKYYRNQGYGTKMLRSIIDKYPNKKFVSSILGGYDNKASIKIFEKNGFYFDNSNDILMAYKDTK